MVWLSDSVFQIRDEAINVLITMKNKMFDLQWFERCIEKKVEEFHTHEKFMQRIHTIFII